MAIKVVTKDCTQLSDAELAEMADICADGPSLYEVGQLSKQVEAWVLVSLAREGNGLKGFSFCTLERIGGTPSVLIGLASIKRTSKRSSVLRAILADQFKRAVMAFPDEDVLMGTRFATASRTKRAPDSAKAKLRGRFRIGMSTQRSPQWSRCWRQLMKVSARCSLVSLNTKVR